MPIPNGFPQVPIRFLIYVNDLLDELAVDSLHYTDDVKLIVLRNRNDILQSFLNVSAR